MFEQEPVKLYAVENEVVILFDGQHGRKCAGGKSEGNSHYVIENTWRKIVRNRPSHYITEK
jgi:hypothetical protein